jgi:hypothetical protein
MSGTDVPSLVDKKLVARRLQVGDLVGDVVGDLGGFG